jgi:hypothetical protein
MAKRDEIQQYRNIEVMVIKDKVVTDKRSGACYSSSIDGGESIWAPFKWNAFCNTDIRNVSG